MYILRLKVTWFLGFGLGHAKRVEVGGGGREWRGFRVRLRSEIESEGQGIICFSFK